MLAEAIARHIIRLLSSGRKPEEKVSSDNHTPEQRSYNMSQIHSEDTKPEVIVGHYLHGKHLRYRKHVQRLPGKPDLVFEKNLLKDDGVFVLEHGKDYEFSAHPHFVEHRSYGSVNFSLFKAAATSVG